MTIQVSQEFENAYLFLKIIKLVCLFKWYAIKKKIPDI